MRSHCVPQESAFNKSPELQSQRQCIAVCQAYNSCERISESCGALTCVYNDDSIHVHHLQRAFTSSKLISGSAGMNHNDLSSNPCLLLDASLLWLHEQDWVAKPCSKSTHCLTVLTTTMPLPFQA